MVNPDTEVSETPRYDLARAIELASEGKVIYFSDKVANDIAKYGYAFDSVCACIQCLTPSHFNNSLKYPDESKWQDSYLITTTSPTNFVDKLYIKFQFNKSLTRLVLRSFHPSEYE